MKYSTLILGAFLPIVALAQPAAGPSGPRPQGIMGQQQQQADMATALGQELMDRENSVVQLRVSVVALTAQVTNLEAQVKGLQDAATVATAEKADLTKKLEDAQAQLAAAQVPVAPTLSPQAVPTDSGTTVRGMGTVTTDTSMHGTRTSPATPAK